MGFNDQSRPELKQQCRYANAKFEETRTAGEEDKNKNKTVNGRRHKRGKLKPGGGGGLFLYSCELSRLVKTDLSTDGRNDPMRLPFIMCPSHTHAFVPLQNSSGRVATLKRSGLKSERSSFHALDGPKRSSFEARVRSIMSRAVFCCCFNRGHSSIGLLIGFGSFSPSKPTNQNHCLTGHTITL